MSLAGEPSAEDVAHRTRRGLLAHACAAAGGISEAHLSAYRGGSSGYDYGARTVAAARFGTLTAGRRGGACVAGGLAVARSGFADWPMFRDNPTPVPLTETSRTGPGCYGVPSWCALQGWGPGARL